MNSPVCGAAASAIAIDLARELLQNHPNKRVLVISTENITQVWGFELGNLPLPTTPPPSS